MIFFLFSYFEKLKPFFASPLFAWHLSPSPNFHFLGHTLSLFLDSMISKRQTIALFANRTSRVFPPSLFNLPPFRHKDNNFFNLDAFLLRLKSPEMKDWRANGTEDGIKFLMLLPRTHKDKDAFIGHLNDVIGAGVPESCRNCENCKDIVCKQTIRRKYFFLCLFFFLLFIFFL